MSERPRISVLLADPDTYRRKAIKRWLLDEPTTLHGPFAETSSGDVAYSILESRGAHIAVLEASLKRTEDKSAAALSRRIALLNNPPRLVLYTNNFSYLDSSGSEDHQTELSNQPNNALAHALVNLSLPDAPARLLEAVSGPKPQRIHAQGYSQHPLFLRH